MDLRRGPPTSPHPAPLLLAVNRERESSCRSTLLGLRFVPFLCSSTEAAISLRQMETQQQTPPPRLTRKSPSRFRRVCVFCGSSPGRKPSYQLAAIQLGNELVERGIDLVYGGGSAGLMGLVSQAVHDGGRHVLGVIPKSLTFKEITGDSIGEVMVVSDMHQRKAEMARQADAFIALPGGYGTMEELLEVVTWAQLGIHDKPVGLLNVDGYYNPLLGFMDKAVDDGFITPAARHILVCSTSAHELMSKLEVYEPRHDGVTSKLSREVKQLGHDPKSDIDRSPIPNHLGGPNQ